MESQKIKNLLDHKNETYSKYHAKNWYIINDINNVAILEVMEMIKESRLIQKL